MRLGCSCAAATAFSRGGAVVAPVEGEPGWDSDDEALKEDLEREKNKKNKKTREQMSPGRGASSSARLKSGSGGSGTSSRSGGGGGDATSSSKTTSKTTTSSSKKTTPQQKQKQQQRREEGCDAYGFPLGELDGDGVKARERCAATAVKRSARWDKYRKAGDAAFADVAHRPDGVLKTLIRKGVPQDLRAKVWMAVSGAAAGKEVHPMHTHTHTPPPTRPPPLFFSFFLCFISL